MPFLLLHLIGGTRLILLLIASLLLLHLISGARLIFLLFAGLLLFHLISGTRLILLLFAGLLLLHLIGGTRLIFLLFAGLLLLHLVASAHLVTGLGLRAFLRRSRIIGRLGLLCEHSAAHHQANPEKRICGIFGYRLHFVSPHFCAIGIASLRSVYPLVCMGIIYPRLEVCGSGVSVRFLKGPDLLHIVSDEH